MFVNPVDHFFNAAGAAPPPPLDGRKSSPIAPDLVAEFIPLLCAAAVFTAALLVHFANQLFGTHQAQALSATLGLASVASIVTYVVFRHGKLIMRSKSGGGTVDGRAVFSAIAIAVLVVSLLLVLLGAEDRYNAFFLSLWLGTSALLIFGAANLYDRLIARKSRFAQRVAIYGDASPAAEVAKILLESELDSCVVEIFGDLPSSHPCASQGRIDDLVERARSGGCDRIIVAMSAGDHERAISVVNRLKAVDVDVQLYAGHVPELFKVHGAFAQGSMLLVNVQRRPLDANGLIIKAAMDYVLGATALVLLSPLMAVIALAIKLDSAGPVFFVQGRTGYRRVVNVIKFRSMTVLENGPVVVQAQRDDPRITRVGRFLRRTSLDELPQLFNVLRGELSLVGPRPHAVAHDEHYAALIEEYVNRSKIKPGITGLAQVSGLRSETRDPELMRLRVKHDLHYIDHWSPWLDIKILVRTVGVVFWDRHAY